MKPQNVFVNYTHPAQQNDPRRRREVATYIGTYYRNRSRPAAKREQRSRESSRTRSAQGSTDGSSTNVGEKPKPMPMQVHNWRLEATTISPLRMRDGNGFKTDPFNSYPVRATERMPVALEYFFEAYAPTHLIRSNLPRERSPKQLLHSYVRYAMQNAAMFESIVTLAFCNMNIRLWAGGLPDHDTSYHYGSTLAHLRAALSTEAGMQEDATVLAILSLVGAEYLLGNVDAYKAHSQALIHIVQYRGGLHEVGWQDITKPVVAGMLGTDSLVAQGKFYSTSSSDKLRSMVVDKQVLDRHLGKGLTPAKPNHALPTIELPPGLKTLAQEGRLTDAAILLAKVTLRNPQIDLRHANPAANTALSLELTEYIEWQLGTGDRSLPDYILIMALHRELYDLGRAERLAPFYEDVVMHWTYECLRVIEHVEPDDGPLAEMFIWACFKHGGTMVAPFLNMESNDPDDLRSQLMTRVMSKFPQVRDWSYLQDLLLRFGPMPECMHWWHLVWQRMKRDFELSHSTLP